MAETSTALAAVHAAAHSSLECSVLVTCATAAHAAFLREKVGNSLQL